MPIKLVPPRPGKTPCFYGRGEHLGESVNRSTGVREARLARRVIAKWEEDIERGVFARPGDPTFASAALAYMKAGGERAFMTPLLHHFKETPLKAIDQTAIDNAAEVLYPGRSAATKNRQVYTPVSAVLRRAGIALALKRPKGHAGRELKGWLWPEQAQALLAACNRLDREFGAFCTFLLATGERLGSGLSLKVDLLRIDEAFAYIETTKNGDPRPVHLPPFAVAALANHPRGLDRAGERVFHFHKGSRLYAMLRTAAKAANVVLPEREAFHIFCHTYGTWMRRYGGADDAALLATKRWKNIKSLRRYTHTVVAEEARRSDLFPFGAVDKAPRRGLNVDSKRKRRKS